MQRRHTLAGSAVAASLTLLLTACGGSSEASDEASDGASSGSGDSSGAAPLAVSYAGGIAVLDGETLEPVEEYDAEEFTRLNPAGDGRHVLVTTSEGFQVLDTRTPELTDRVFAAEAAGHVVRHAGRTVLYADGTGETTVFDTDALAESGEELPETTTYTAPEAHHGVSIVLEDGTLVTTVGNEETRSGAVALAEHDGAYHADDEIASSDQCPGIHGEGTAAGEAVVFGCEDGALLFTDGAFRKLQAPDAYGRMGNAYVSEDSPHIVGDYNAAPDDEGYLLDQAVLIDTAAATYRVVDLPKGVEYTWRGVVRGPEEKAYVLGTDGAIHVLDPATGEFGESFPVVDPWEGPSDWQVPHPALAIGADGKTAYVADPADKEVHAVDLTTGEVTATAQLDHEPNEMASTLGCPPPPAKSHLWGREISLLGPRNLTSGTPRAQFRRSAPTEPSSRHPHLRFRHPTPEISAPHT